MAMLCLVLPNFRAAAKVAARGGNFEEVMTIDGGEAAIRMVITSVLAEHGEIGGRAFDALSAMRPAAKCRNYLGRLFFALAFPPLPTRLLAV
jgi:hypothetical protein